MSSLRNLLTTNLKSEQKLNVASISLTPTSDTDLILSQYSSQVSDISWGVNTLSSNNVNGIRLLKLGNMIHGWFANINITGTFVGAATQMIGDFVIPAEYDVFGGATTMVGAGQIIISGTSVPAILFVISSGGAKFAITRADNAPFPAGATDVIMSKMTFSYPSSFS